MIIGHYGLAFAAKRAHPKLSLGTLFLAVQLPDILFSLFAVLGLESERFDPGGPAAFPYVGDLPWSHSLIGITAAALAMAATVALWRGRDARAFGVVFLAVLSHWILDFISHVDDMRIFPRGSGYGLGLWQSLPGTIAVELGLFLGGLFLYSQAPGARYDSRRLARLSAFLIILHGISLLPQARTADTSQVTVLMFPLFVGLAIAAARVEN